MKKNFVLASILFITLVLAFGCKVEETKAPNQNDYFNKSLAAHFIGRLGVDLDSAGASSNQRDSILSAADRGLESKNLKSSTNTQKVAAQVLLSAQLSLANGSTGVTSDSERSKLIDVIVGSVSSSLKGKVSSGSVKITGLPKRFQSTSGSSYAAIFKTLAETSISNLDESGLSTKSVLTAVKTVTQCVAKNLKTSGVDSADYDSVLLAVAQGAVASLDDAKIGNSSLDKAVENVVKGLLSGAKSSVTKKADLLDLTDEIAEGAILGLADVGVSFDDSASYVSTISSAVETELTNQGFTSDQATTASETAQTAAKDGLFILGEGRSGDPGIIATTISGNISETGDQATFEVRLKTQPSASVGLTLSSSDETEGTVEPTSLTFTVDNWNARQTVTVTGVDDDFADGNVSFTVDLGPVTSNDEVYDGSAGTQVAVVNTDDETPGLVVSAISGDTAEDGTTANFTVKLQGKPEADVTVNVASDDETEGTASPTTLTFTSENWNANQTVTVTGQDDDLYDRDQEYGVVLTAGSESAGYDGLKYDGVLVVNVDDDSAGAIVSEISGDTGEDGTSATFSVKLTSEPLATVSIDITSDDATEGTASPTSLSFTSTNWNTQQTVTITGINDDMADGDQDYTITLVTAQSTDEDYNGLNPTDISVTNIDDDSAGITVGSISGDTTEEGGTATFTVVLTSQPIADVTIPLSSSDTGEGIVSPSSLTFTTYDWDTAQTVTVTGVNDYLVDGDQSYSVVLGAASSNDNGYDGMNPNDVAVSNIDDDSPNIIVSSISGDVSERGDSATFTVHLTSDPSADVVISVSSDDTTEATTDVSSITLNSSNWNSGETVTVTGVDDTSVDGDVSFQVLLGAAVSADPNYDGLNPSDVSGSNLDLEIVIGSISGDTSEEGGTATFTVVLTNQPTTDVTIPLSSSDEGEGTVSPSSLTFTADDWDTAQTVTVTGVNDYLVDGDQSYSVVLGAATSSDAGYDGINPADVSVTNIDDVNGPTVTSTVPADGATYVSLTSDISVTFSEPMDTATLTTNTADTTCSGSIQVSLDSFTTCVQMSAAPTTSNGDQTYSVTPAASLSGATTYKIRVTTVATDKTGNAMANAYTTASGFMSTTTTDPSTNLMWQDNGYETLHTWQSALDYCDALDLGGYTDWRLPDKDELSGLYNNRAILASYISSYYWSSTTFATNTKIAWNVYFSNGYAYHYGKTLSFYVRCVRP